MNRLVFEGLARRCVLVHRGERDCVVHEKHKSSAGSASSVFSDYSVVFKYWVFPFGGELCLLQGGHFDLTGTEKTAQFCCFVPYPVAI